MAADAAAQQRFEGEAPPDTELDDPLQVLFAVPAGTPTTFPCVDCGLMTGNFCDGSPSSVGYDRCFTADRVPKDFPPEVYGQMRTPLCSYCETCFGYCRFCCGVSGCTPPNRTCHWSGVPQALSRDFTEERAQLEIQRELADLVDKRRQEARDTSQFQESP